MLDVGEEGGVAEVALLAGADELSILLVWLEWHQHPS